MVAPALIFQLPPIRNTCGKNWKHITVPSEANLAFFRWNPPLWPEEIRSLRLIMKPNDLKAIREKGQQFRCKKGRISPVGGQKD